MIPLSISRIKCAIAFFGFFISHCSIAQVSMDRYVSIPDSLFEKALIELKIDSEGKIDGRVLEKDVSEVKKLFIHDRKIASLDGISGFRSLEELGFSGNAVSSVDLNSNTNLYKVYGGSNKLTGTLDLSRLAKLKEINFAYNKIDSLLIASTDSLISINLESNRLKSFNYPKNDFQNLLSLRLGANYISEIDVSVMPALAYLRISQNKLQELDLSKNLNLSKINVSKNNLTSLKLENLPYLIELDCWENELVFLDLPSSIQEISCRDNQIEEFIVSNLKDLEDLDCSNNKLISLNLSQNNKLQTLSVSGNLLSNLEMSNLNEILYFNAENNPNLDKIVLSNNFSYNAKLIKGSNSKFVFLDPYVEVTDDIFAN